MLPAVEDLLRQGHPVLVHHLRRAVGAAGDPEGLPRLLDPDEPAPRRRPPLDDGGLPAVGQLGLLPAHHHEQRAGAYGEAEHLQVGDGLDDGGAGAGHRHLHLPLPLGHQVGRAEYQHPLEARHVRGGGPDEGLSRAHLAHDGGAPVGFEGEGRALDGIGLRPQGPSEQAGQNPAVLRGAVERRVGLDHAPGDGVLELSMNSPRFISASPFLIASLVGRREPRRTTPPGGNASASVFLEASPRRPGGSCGAAPEPCGPLRAARRGPSMPRAGRSLRAFSAALWRPRSSVR